LEIATILDMTEEGRGAELEGRRDRRKPARGAQGPTTAKLKRQRTWTEITGFNIEPLSHQKIEKDK
jgi:hypothetical protein